MKRLFSHFSILPSALGLVTLLAVGATAQPAAAQPASGDLRIGIIGLDTSHVIAFSKIINAENPPENIKGAKIVAAFPGGSPDLPSSADRIEGFTQQIRAMDIEIVDSIEELLPKVDAVLLESVDGRVHWEQIQPVIRAKKPVFVDKPIAASLVDAIAILEYAKRQQVPIFSSSSSRFTPGYQEIVDDPKTGRVMGATVYGRTSVLPFHPDLFNYGIHGTELLFTLMGEGCQSVRTVSTDGFDHVTGQWDSGRVGSYWAIKEPIAARLGATVFGEKKTTYCDSYYDYKPLVNEIVQFFRTGEAPVPANETIEIVAFLTAAEQSKAENGATVQIKDVIEAARTEALKKVEAAEAK